MLHNINLRQKIIVMAAVMSGLFLVALDQTIISTALAKIVEEFNSFSSLSWVVTSYLLASTVTVPLAGKFSDIFGRRLVLLIGVAVFTVASLLSGTAQNIEQLIIFRGLQGVGGGIIMANAFTIVGDLFTPRERGRWQGVIGAVFGLSSVLGPLLGGFLTDEHFILGLTTNWRWTFLVNVPIGVAAFYLIARYCPPIKHDHQPRIDYLGAAALTVALSSIILAVDNTENIFGDLISSGYAVADIRVILGILAGLAIIAFVYFEKRAAEPIIPLNFFANRNFSVIMAVVMLFGASFLASIIYLTQFNQQVFSATATEAGLMLLPMIIGLTLSSVITGQFVAKTGKYKAFIVGGFSLATISVLVLSSLTPDSTYLYEAIIIALVGIGMGTGMPILNLAVQNEFSQRDLGAATASSQLFRGLGSTIGVAIMGALLTSNLAVAVSSIHDDPYIQQIPQQPSVQQLTKGSPADVTLKLNTTDAKEQLRQTKSMSLDETDVSSHDKQLAMDEFNQLQENFNDRVTSAFSDSLQPLFYLAAALMGLATVGSMLIIERPLRSDSGGHAG